MYKVVIVEDDAFAQEMLCDLLSKFPDYVITGMFPTAKASIKALPVLSPDLVFLDIELPDGKGFDILEELPQINFEIIISTMHDAYMLQAFKHSAIDYLLKPVTENDLTGALKRFESKTAIDGSSQLPTAPKSNKIILSMNEEMLFLNIMDIVRLESDGSYTHFYTTQKKKYTTSRTMATYESKLLPHGFFRVHHSHLINTHSIGKYVKGDGGYVVMSDGSSVEVSRRKRQEFLDAIGQSHE